MMDTLIVGAGSALWLGILTSISPCPLTTNIAALSYISKHLGNSNKVIASGILYTLGRIITYLAVGAIVTAGLLSIPSVALFLQNQMNKIIGPILLLVGLLLLEIIKLEMLNTQVSQKFVARLESHGLWGAGLLGIVFALTFCPVSAALFFGSLIPLAMKHESSILMPSLYGIGTGLPVLLFAFMIALGAQSIGNAFKKLTKFEWWAQRITGIIFLLVGGYFCLKHLFGVSI